MVKWVGLSGKVGRLNGNRAGLSGKVESVQPGQVVTVQGRN